MLHMPTAPPTSYRVEACEWTLVLCVCGEQVAVTDEQLHKFDGQLAVAAAFLAHGEAFERAHLNDPVAPVQVHQ